MSKYFTFSAYLFLSSFRMNAKKITFLGHIHEWSSFMLQLKKMIYNLLHHTAR